MNNSELNSDLRKLLKEVDDVERIIGKLREEIERDMILMGVNNIDQLSKKNLKFR